MGKVLIIKGADFSANNVAVDHIKTDKEIAEELLSSKFEYGYSISLGNPIAKTSTINPKRCCIYGMQLDEIARMGYTKVKISFAEGINYIGGTGTPDNFHPYNDTMSEVGMYTWQAGGSIMIPVAEDTNFYIHFKLLLGDVETAFDSDVVASDIIKDVTLM